MRTVTLTKIALAAGLLVFAPACGGDDTAANNGAANNGGTSNNGKGDIPSGEADELCEARLEDVTKTGKPRFLSDAVRWPCGDVEGVNTEGGDDRGQEYCEYFVVTQVPNESGDAFEEDPAVVGHKSTGLSLEEDVNDDGKFFLEDNSDEVVGKCVFTSWHSDVRDPLPCEDTGDCPDVYGVQPNADLFRMTSSINSNSAASDLVQKCVAGTVNGNYLQGDPEDPDDLLHDHFYRGCFLVEGIFGTHWRSSDPQICAASMRLAECGCTVGGDPDADFGFALVPTISQQKEEHGGISLRGFPLGTWSGADELPAGCRYMEVGNEADDNPSQTLVECDIKGSDLLANLGDPKEFCRQQYGDDVVLHVPIPGDAIVCEPEGSDRAYAETCGEEPWVVTDDASAQ